MCRPTRRFAPFPAAGNTGERLNYRVSASACSVAGATGMRNMVGRSAVHQSPRRVSPNKRADRRDAAQWATGCHVVRIRIEESTSCSGLCVDGVRHCASTRPIVRVTMDILVTVDKNAANQHLSRLRRAEAQAAAERKFKWYQACMAEGRCTECGQPRSIPHTSLPWCQPCREAHVRTHTASLARVGLEPDLISQIEAMWDDPASERTRSSIAA